jgi:hypothetical protein
MGHPQDLLLSGVTELKRTRQRMREETHSAVTMVGASAPTEVGTAAMRRSGRLSRQVSILLIGSDTEGTVFCEETHTVVLSLHGAGVVSRQRLVAEQELVLRVFGTGREAEIRVVGEIAREGDVHTYGVAFLDEKLDFWGVEFPAAPIWEEWPEVLTLECGSCKELVELRNGDFEYDICVTHGGLPRFCDECGYLTVWRRSSEVMPIAKTANRKWKMENRKDEEDSTQRRRAHRGIAEKKKADPSPAESAGSG